MNEKQRRIYRFIQWSSGVDIVLLIGLWVLGLRFGMSAIDLVGWTFLCVLWLVMMLSIVRGPLRML